MIEQILKWEVKVEDKVSHWIFPNNLPIVVLEQMAMQFLQGLGKIKEAQAQAASEVEKKKEAETPASEVHQEHIEQLQEA